ncbi:MAG: hypothetical protein VB959_04185 [Rhodospirillales bacterium]
MATILPQQRLFLELLIMSGDIAISDNLAGTILQRTLSECEQKAWIKTEHVANGFDMITITNHGRRAAKQD